MNALHRFVRKGISYFRKLVRTQSLRQAKLMKEATNEHILWTASARDGLVFCFWIGPR